MWQEQPGRLLLFSIHDMAKRAPKFIETVQYSQLLINRVSGQYNIKAPALYERIQAVLDYISGMTDVFALDLYRKINGNSLPAV